MITFSAVQIQICALINITIVRLEIDLIPRDKVHYSY